jgi:hypothetical protein
MITKEMFYGELSFEGSPFLSDIILVVGFLTTVLYFAQDPGLEIRPLDIIQTLFCWPSFFEGLLATICLWSFRHIERMLGIRGLFCYFAYNAVTYLGAFFMVLGLKGFRAHFSLLNFVLYSLYVFMFWKIPAVLYADPLTDKFVVSLSMFLIVLAKLPYSILAMGSAVAGFYLWSIDLFRFRYLSNFEREVPVVRERWEDVSA